MKQVKGWWLPDTDTDFDRWILDGGLLKELGWEPKVSIDERINQVVNWTLNNDRWLKL